MKKSILLAAISCFFAIPAWAQHATHSSKSAGTSLPADKSKMLCKAWKLDTLSEFGVDNPAKGKNANDCITFGTDGTFSFTQDGTPSTGTWTYSGGRLVATIVSPEKGTFSFQIVSLSDNKLVLAYQFPAPDLTRVQYTYSPKQ